MWKTDCEKEEKLSQNRQGIKKLSNWQLDHVRNNGNSKVNETNQTKPRENLLNKQPQHRTSFAQTLPKQTETSQRTISNSSQHGDQKGYMLQVCRKTAQRTIVQVM